MHSLEPGEAPSYSASHQAPKYVQRSLISQNILKQFDTVPLFFLVSLNSILCPSSGLNIHQAIYFKLFKMSTCSLSESSVNSEAHTAMSH